MQYITIIVSSSNKNNLSDSTENLTDFDSYENTHSGIKFKFPKNWQIFPAKAGELYSFW